MIIGNDPGPWQYYVNRADNKGLNVMVVRDKYLNEQLIFENQMMSQYMSNQVGIGMGDNTQNDYVELGYVENYIW
jgi:hypothetical protein